MVVLAILTILAILAISTWPLYTIAISPKLEGNLKFWQDMLLSNIYNDLLMSEKYSVSPKRSAGGKKGGAGAEPSKDYK